MFVTIFSGLSALLTVIACAVTVGHCLKVSRMVSEIRSLSSLQSEIVEIDACVRSLLLTIRRMEGRQTARMRSDETEATTSEPELLDKAALRARYFTPGQPMRQTDGDRQIRQHTPGPSDTAERFRGSRPANTGS